MYKASPSTPILRAIWLATEAARIETAKRAAGARGRQAMVTHFALRLAECRMETRRELAKIERETEGET